MYIHTLYLHAQSLIYNPSSPKSLTQVAFSENILQEQHSFLYYASFDTSPVSLACQLGNNITVFMLSWS